MSFISYVTSGQHSALVNNCRLNYFPLNLSVHLHCNATVIFSSADLIIQMAIIRLVAF